jgi:hypothetical protein
VNSDQFIKTGIRLHGRKIWKARLARDLGVDVSTIHRIAKRLLVPGPVEIAIKALVNNRIAQDKLEKEARKLLPRKLRKRSPKATLKRRKKINAAGMVQRDRAVSGAVAAQPDSGEVDS